MATLAWKGKRAYIVHCTTAEGKAQRRWEPLGEFDTKYRGKEAYAQRLAQNKIEPNTTTSFDIICRQYLEQPGIAAKKKHILDRIISMVNVLNREFGQYRLDQIDVTAVENFLKKHKTWKPNTIRLKLTELKKVLAYAKAKGYKVADPWEGVKIPRPKTYKMAPKYVDRSVADLIFSKLPGNYQYIFLILCYTGMRPGEYWSLKHEDIREDIIVINASKTDSQRIVPIHPDLSWLLKPFHPPTIKQNTFNQVLWRACEAAGLPKNILTPHGLRHSFATWLYEKTKDLRTVQQVLGHTTINMTTRYAFSTPEAITTAVNSL